MSDLHENRARVWHQAKALLDRVAREKRGLDAVEQAEYDRLDAKLDEYDAEIRRQDADSAAARAVIRPATIGPARDDELTRFLRGETAHTSMEFDLRNVESKRHRNGAIEVRERRDLLVGTAAAGGNTVPTSFHKELQEFLTEVTPAFQIGAMTITTDGGNPLDIPTQATHGTAAIVGEGTALAENDPTFSKVTLSSYKYGQLLQVSNELLADTGVDLQSFIAKNMARALSESFGSHFTTGTGTNQPKGYMAGQYGTGVVGQTASTGLPSYANLVDMQHSINSQYRRNATWIFKDSSWGGIRKITSPGGDYILEPSMKAGVPDQLLGSPVVTDPNMNAFGTGVLCGAYGDWGDAYAIRQAGAIRLERSADYAFNQDLMTFRAVARIDAKPLMVDAARVYRGGAS
jgi:HK97 family phage major capsid protein